MARRISSFFSASALPPDGPFHGERWIDTASGIEYTWSGDITPFWVEGGCSEALPITPEIDEVYETVDQQWKWNGVGWAKLRLFKIDSEGAVVTDYPVVIGGKNLNDTLDMLLGVPMVAVLAVTEASDVAAFNVITQHISATMAATEARDTAVFLGGGVPITGALAATEAQDSAAFAATLKSFMTMAATESPDVAYFRAPTLLELIEALQNSIDGGTF